MDGTSKSSYKSSTDFGIHPSSEYYTTMESVRPIESTLDLPRGMKSSGSSTKCINCYVNMTEDTCIHSTSICHHINVENSVPIDIVSPGSSRRRLYSNRSSDSFNGEASIHSNSFHYKVEDHPEKVESTKPTIKKSNSFKRERTESGEENPICKRKFDQNNGDSNYLSTSFTPTSEGVSTTKESREENGNTNYLSASFTSTSEVLSPGNQNFEDDKENVLPIFSTEVHFLSISKDTNECSTEAVSVFDKEVGQGASSSDVESITTQITEEVTTLEEEVPIENKTNDTTLVEHFATVESENSIELHTPVETVTVLNGQEEDDTHSNVSDRSQCNGDKSESDDDSSLKAEPVPDQEQASQMNKEEEDEEDPLSFIQIKSAAQWKAVSKRISWNFDESSAKTEETDFKPIQQERPISPATPIKADLKKPPSVVCDYENIKYDIHCKEVNEVIPNFKPTK